MLKMLTTDINELRTKLHKLNERYMLISQNKQVSIQLGMPVQEADVELESIDKQIERITYLLGTIDV